MSLDFADDKSTMVQVMAWCRQATSHYLSQCWPRSMSPNGVTRPQWVNSLITTVEKYIVNEIHFFNKISTSHLVNPLWTGLAAGVTTPIFSNQLFSQIFRIIKTSNNLKWPPFTEDPFERIFFNISIKISLKFVPNGRINNIPALHGSGNGLALTRLQAIVILYMRHSASCMS